MKIFRAFILLAMLSTCFPDISGEKRRPLEIEFEACGTVNAGTGDFAPHYMSALGHGKLTQTNGVQGSIGACKRRDVSSGFSWSAGVELGVGVASASEYKHWSADGVEYIQRMRPADVWIQQLYAEVKWRSLFLEAGMKERGSALLNDILTSGDVVESGNARPVPQLRAGFVDFQNVPLTDGWLQIQGELGYGKFADGGWMKKLYSYGSYHLNTGAYYVYRRLYFRTNTEKNVSVTFGMQAAGEIGGVTRYYRLGQLVKTRNLKAGLWDMIKMIAPIGSEKHGEGEYMDGNNLGSWDVHVRWRLPWSGDVVKMYMQKPWEKGSSIGWHNGWDALWGIEYKFGNSFGGIVTGAVVEYLDFMNQSGAIHYAPHDRPGSTIETDVSGGDQYYNNSEYNSYTNYGLGIGSPFLVSPLYNRDGYPAYVDNRVRGFHAAVTGSPKDFWSYRAAISHKKGYGDGRQPRAPEGKCTSWLIEVSYYVSRVKGLKIKARIAMDRGTMPGDNFGASLSGIYRFSVNMWQK